MRQDITVYEVEEKWTKKQPPTRYWSLKTDVGKINVFDSAIAVVLQPNTVFDVELIESGGFKNIKQIYEVKGMAKAQSQSEGNYDARMRRIADCVLKAEEAFIQDRINKEQIAEHARSLYNLIEEIANAGDVQNS